MNNRKEFKDVIGEGGTNKNDKGNHVWKYFGSRKKRARLFLSPPAQRKIKDSDKGRSGSSF